MDRHYIDKRVSEELEGLEVNPPVEAWMGISDAIDRRARRRRLPLLMGMAASFAAIAVIALSLWMVQPFDRQADWTADRDALPGAMVSLAAAPLEQAYAYNLPGARSGRGVQAWPRHREPTTCLKVPMSLQWNGSPANH